MQETLLSLTLNKLKKEINRDFVTLIIDARWNHQLVVAFECA